MKTKTHKDSALSVLKQNNIGLPLDFVVNDTQGTWLRTGKNDVMWFRLDTNHWLEISINPDSQPAVYIGVLTSTEKDLAFHINNNCKGWWIRDLNIKGVKFEPKTSNDERATVA